MLIVALASVPILLCNQGKTVVTKLNNTYQENHHYPKHQQVVWHTIKNAWTNFRRHKNECELAALLAPHKATVIWYLNTFFVVVTLYNLLNRPSIFPLFDRPWRSRDVAGMLACHLDLTGMRKKLCLVIRISHLHYQRCNIYFDQICTSPTIILDILGSIQNGSLNEYLDSITCNGAQRLIIIFRSLG